MNPVSNYWGWSSEFIVCCDNNETIAKYFLEETEYVPYRNEYFDAGAVSRNRVGYLYGFPVIPCDFGDQSFSYPHPIGDDSTSGQQYQCCKTGPGMNARIRPSKLPFTLWSPSTLSELLFRL